MSETKTTIGYRARVEANIDVNSDFRIERGANIEGLCFHAPNGNIFTPTLALEVYDPSTGETHIVTRWDTLREFGLNVTDMDSGFEKDDTEVEGLPEIEEGSEPL